MISNVFVCCVFCFQLYQHLATSSMHDIVQMDGSFITADQFTYRLSRCLQLTCISLSWRMAHAAVVWKRFTQTLVQRVFDCRGSWMKVWARTLFENIYALRGWTCTSQKWHNFVLRVDKLSFSFIAAVARDVHSICHRELSIFCSAMSGDTTLKSHSTQKKVMSLFEFNWFSFLQERFEFFCRECNVLGETCGSLIHSCIHSFIHFLPGFSIILSKAATLRRPPSKQQTS